MHEVRISKAWQAAIGIQGLTLEPLPGGSLPAAAPGSHIDVHLADGLVRQYSICNGPEERKSYTIAVKREDNSRGGSVAMHALREGDTISIGSPRNNFPLAPDGDHHILLAGGVGATPLVSMARHLHSAAAGFEFHYFTRSIEHAIFPELFADDQPYRTTKLQCGLDADATRQMLTRILANRAARHHVYVCGPVPFMDLAVEIALAGGWPAGHVHREYFSAPATEDGEDGRAFTLEAQRSGRIVEVGKSETIVAALARSGIFIDVSCEQGICGTCLTKVVRGTVDHRDFFLTDDEKLANDKMCPCVSRSKHDVIVLDV